MEEMGYHGYQALGQGPLNGEASEDSDEESEEESDTEQGAIEAQASLSGTPGVPAFPEEISPDLQGQYPDYPHSANLPGYLQAPDVPKPDKKDLLWNQPHQVDLTMDKGHVEKVKSVMTAIQIPMANIPDWAKSLSEDQWQGHVDKLVKTETSPKQEINKSKDMKYGDSRTKEELNEFTSEKNSNISGPSEISGFDVNENT
ncbi:male-enhanced antigen 1-like isoform X2 [Mya arenaria]|nr:male-enhanced antigen 1-like isoform X2 [Mya arenaria]